MKSTKGWNDDGNGTNSSGFSGLPGGYRLGDGNFRLVGYYGYWWSASENDASGAWARVLNDLYSNLYRDYYAKNYGFSIRCVKD